MKKINYQLLKDQDYNVIIKLEKRLNNISTYETVGVSDTPTVSSTKIITGTATSRLNEVRGYNLQTPFIAGKNGVLEVGDDYVKYQIDNVIYVTNLTTGGTTYEYEVPIFSETEEHIIPYQLDVVENPNFPQKVNIDRKPQSVFESHYRLSGLSSIAEIEAYGVGYFNL